MIKCSAILLAAGKSQRFSKKRKKQFVKIYNKTILEYSLKKFLYISEITEIIVVVSSDKIKKASKIISKYNDKNNKKIKIATGGKERYDSVFNAKKAIDNNSKYVIIHDVARPLVTKKLIKNCIKNVRNNDCVIPVIPVVDTLKLLDEKKFVKKTIDRKHIFAVQTPQVFKKEVFLKIYSDNIIKKWSKKINITDDSVLAELEGYKIKTIEGEKTNIKITTKQDIEIVRYYIRKL